MPLPFTDTITCHGAPYFVQPPGSNQYVSGNSFAKQYASDPAHSQVKSIDFRSCYSANGGPTSNAQMLSNQTGAAVTGYQGTYSGLNNNPVTFHPQSSASASVCGAINSAFGGVGGAGANAFK